MVRRSWLWLLGLLLAAGGLPAPAHAHAGAPYVVLPEQLVGPYTVIVWADPELARRSSRWKWGLAIARRPTGRR